MAKKFIDVMDTSFRDGFQSVLGARVLSKDYESAIKAAKQAGITHFEMGGGALFQSMYFYANEDAFSAMRRFRQIVGDEANLQTLARGINTVSLETSSKEIIQLHAKLFAKYGVSTIRNFDALNDVENLKYSAEQITNYGLKHEVTITMMHLNSNKAHDCAFYEKILKQILKEQIPFTSICFKDATGTSSPQKVYETIKMARKLLPSDTHIRLHTHESAGVSVACYLAAIKAGADGIDLAVAPFSGGTSQPDILTMMHALKGENYNLGDFEEEKIRKYEEVFKECMKEYFMPPEASRVNALIPFCPMPGGALTTNTQMMRDNNLLDKFEQTIEQMQEVVELGGYATSVTPVSQFYFQQAFNNVLFGKWEKIAEGYGKMVLGYYGKTPIKADKKIIQLAKEQLKLEETTKSALSIADADETKSIKYLKSILEKENLSTSDENIFILATCKEKGLAFLKNEAKQNIRKISSNIQTISPTKQNDTPSFYVVNVNGNKYNVEVCPCTNDYKIQEQKPTQNTNINKDKAVLSSIPGNVFKVLKKENETVKKDEVLFILEAMKMQIQVQAPCDGVLLKIFVKEGDVVENEQALALYK